jgi:hypothetical protein
LPFSGVHFGYLGMMCVASAGMAIALLLSPGVATLTVALLAVTSGLVLNNELRFTVVTLGRLSWASRPWRLCATEMICYARWFICAYRTRC